MVPSRLRSAFRRVVPPPPPSGQALTDAELLTRFLDGHDEEAFAELVRRHVATVRSACRTLLRDPNDIDDATQATFLVLARRAETVRDRAALGGWLHRVAWRAANRVRAENATRLRRFGGTGLDAAPAPATNPEADDRGAVFEEIARLPEAYRVAVLTCYVAGVPTADAAARLGWPKGTLLTRLAWARKRLRSRLAGRGVAFAAGSFAALLADPAGRSAGAALAGRIGRAAALVSARELVPRELVSDRTSSITEGVVRAMAWNKTGIAAGVGLFAVALLGIGLGRMTVADAADGSDKGRQGAAAKPAAAKLTTTRVANPSEDEDQPAAAVPVKLPDGPGNDLVVRRPHGSFTREVAPFGKATLTFAENRLRVTATVNIDKVSFTATADADYSINRESMVYGVITGVDVTGPLGVDKDGAAEIALMAGAANDIPFAFRVRVEDDAVTVKDLKIGPFGSPIFAELFGASNGNVKEATLITAAIGGKFKADPNPVAERAAAPANQRKR